MNMNRIRHKKLMTGSVTAGVISAAAIILSMSTNAMADDFTGGNDSDIEIIYIGSGSTTYTTDPGIIIIPGDGTGAPTQTTAPQTPPTQTTAPQTPPTQTTAPQTPPTQTTAPPSTSSSSNGTVTIDIVTVNGSGCPSGTAAVAVSPDNEALSVTYSQYIVETGATTEKNCQLSMVVNVPSGRTYAVASADYRGYADLASGATGTLRSTYYFAGAAETTYTIHDIPGSRTGNWQFNDQVPYQDMVWHPCGAKRNLNVNTRLSVNSGSSNGRGLVSMDSTDVSFSTVYHFRWGTC